jgi:hypothetical protein
MQRTHRVNSSLSDGLMKSFEEPKIYMRVVGRIRWSRRSCLRRSCLRRSCHAYWAAVRSHAVARRQTSLRRSEKGRRRNVEPDGGRATGLASLAFRKVQVAGVGQQHGLIKPAFVNRMLDLDRARVSQAICPACHFQDRPAK